MIFEIIAGLLLLTGAFFSLLAGVGILRFPDLYTRMHAASKAGTLGSCLMLLAIAFVAYDASVSLRAIAGVIFFLLTAPISSHLLARCSYVIGLTPWAGTIRDAYADYRARQ